MTGTILEMVLSERSENLKILELTKKLNEQKDCLEILEQKYRTERMVATIVEERLKELKHAFADVEEQFSAVKAKIYSSIGHMSRGHAIEYSWTPFSTCVEEASRNLYMFQVGDLSLNKRDADVIEHRISNAQNLMLGFKSDFDGFLVIFHDYVSNDCQKKGEQKVKKYKEQFKQLIKIMTNLQSTIAQLKAPRAMQYNKEIVAISAALTNGNLFEMLEDKKI